MNLTSLETFVSSASDRDLAIFEVLKATDAIYGPVPSVQKVFADIQFLLGRIGNLELDFQGVVNELKTLYKEEGLPEQVLINLAGAICAEIYYQPNEYAI